MGGAQRTVVHLIRGLDPTRFDVAAVSMYAPLGTDLEEMLAAGGHRVWYLGKRPGFEPRMFFLIDRVIREFRPHVVHSHTMSLRYGLPAILARPVAARLHTIHSLAATEAGSWVWLRQLAFRLGVVPVAIADEVKDSISWLYGIFDCPNIPNGIPVEVYRTPSVSPGEWRRQQQVPSDDVLFVTVGRLDPLKNHDLMLEAFSTVRAADPRAKLAIVGEESRDSFRVRLEAKTRALGLEHAVRFLGRRTDIPDVLAAADVFVLSSDFEGNPLTVMEAMAAGKPVISTAVGGVPELVEHGVSGVLVKKGDAAELSRAMLNLLRAPEVRQSMGLAGGERALRRFDVRAMADAYGELYEKMIAERSR
jgi:glycosyltransferase involved in cell wall biosynthesis